MCKRKLYDLMREDPESQMNPTQARVEPERQVHDENPRSPSGSHGYDTFSIGLFATHLTVSSDFSITAGLRRLKRAAPIRVAPITRIIRSIG